MIYKDKKMWYDWQWKTLHHRPNDEEFTNIGHLTASNIEQKLYHTVNLNMTHNLFEVYDNVFLTIIFYLHKPRNVIGIMIYLK